MAAKKKPVQTLSLADLGVAADEVGFAGATSAVVEHTKRPPRSGGTKITDEGTAASSWSSSSPPRSSSEREG